MTTQLSPQPLDKFIESVASARYEEARLWPGATVESAGAFEQMQAYVLDLYRGVDPVESFVETDGQVIDCIREDMHPAARRWDGLAIAPAESPPQVPESHEPAPPDPRSRDRVACRHRAISRRSTAPVYLHNPAELHDGHSFFNLDSGGFHLTNNAWWFFFNDKAVGSYPVPWSNNGPLTTKATRAKFGGEVGNGVPIGWPPMGSGQHASAGFRQAAYQRAAAINPVSGGGVFATLAEAGSVSGTCYSLQITNNTTSPDWGSYLYFGGPGGTGC